MKHSSHRFGTRTTGGLDPASLREGLASPGLDTRFWESLGTVGTIDDSGEPNYSDPHSVWIGPEGVECDVILQPLMQRVTALWGFGGEIADIAPIHPGDQVLVACPSGDLMTPVITTIIHSRANKQPMTAGVPIFDNKRRLIYARKGDIDVRVASGNHSTEASGAVNVKGDTFTATASKATLESDDVRLGGVAATEPLVLGQTRSTAETTFLTAAAAAVAALETVAGLPANPLLAPLVPGFTALAAALTSFLSELPTFLSTVSRTK